MNRRRFAGFYLMSLSLFYLVVAALNISDPLPREMSIALAQVLYFPFHLIQAVIIPILSQIGYVAGYSWVYSFIVYDIPSFIIFFLGWVLWREPRHA